MPLRVVVAGWTVVAAVVLGVAMAQIGTSPVDPWVTAAVVASIALATAIPVLAQTTVADDTAQGHVAVLVPAIYLLPWHGVALAVAAGVAAGWMLRRIPGLRSAPPASRRADVFASVSRATLAAASAGLVGDLAAPGGDLRFAVAVAAAIVFLSAARGMVVMRTTATGQGDPPGPIWERGLQPMAIQLAALAFGLVTALAAAAHPAPAVWLSLQTALGTAIAAGLFAIDTSRARHAALLRIVAHTHASMDLADVGQAVHGNLTPLVYAARVDIRDRPPGPADLGMRLPLESGDPAWLVATPRGRAPHSFPDRDRRLLTAAAPHVATAVENARRHTAMAARAATDPLTGVANRRTFKEQVSLRLRQGRATDAATAMVVLDLDDFKAVNDQISHRAGDELLVEVARRLGGALRRGDLVARLGGDEFAVVATLVSADEEHALRDRLARRLADLHAADGRLVTVSMGIALSPRDGHTARELYDAADERMYAVKHVGRVGRVGR